MHPGELFLIMAWRDAVLEAVAKHFPEILPYAVSTFSRPQVWTVYVAVRRNGAAKDPLEPLSLDDIAVGDCAPTIFNDLMQLELSASKLSGLNARLLDTVALPETSQLMVLVSFSIQYCEAKKNCFYCWRDSNLRRHVIDCYLMFWPLLDWHTY